MKKLIIHLHLTLQQYPKTDTMFLSSAAQMLPHLEELGIEQGIVLSSGEQENEQILVAANEECKRICEQFPKNVPLDVQCGCKKPRQMCINGS